MVEPRGVGHSPFTQAQIDTIINKIEAGKPLSREEAVPLIRLAEKIKTRAKLAENELRMLGGLVKSVTKGQSKMDKIMEMATSGKKFSPQELLAMQEGMNRYTHELELVTKIVEKTTEGVKKTMQTQV